MKKAVGTNLVTVDEIRDLRTRFENLKEHL
jgi:hypothetical protein